MATEFTAGQYVEDVLAGRVVVNRWIRLAAERHVNDLATGRERGLYFDEKAARLAVAFFTLLNHSKGEWHGRPVVLEPWQQFHFALLFGWKRSDGSRRFRTSYLEVARKNGKSLMAAGVGLYMMAADGEGGAEIYSAATKKDQARIVFGEAQRMVRQSQALQRSLTVFRHNIHNEATFSKFEPLGADSDSLDGLNIHCAIADELHAWRGRALWDVLETATGARRQPLMYAITTAGFDRQSLCYQLHDYTKKVLSGVVENDSFCGLIYSLDEGDDWQDESLWVKANPNLGVSKKWDDMRRLAAQAKEMPSALNAFLRLHLNQWTQAETRWLSRALWDACSTPVDEAALIGRRCYGGLDLSSTTDVTAWVLVFPPQDEEEPWYVRPRFFIPEDNMHERVRRDRVPYDAWERAGYLTATPGNVVDYEWVLAQIDEDAQKFDIAEVAFDRWGAAHIQTQLIERGGEEWLVQFGQGFASMSAPSKEFEKLVLSGKLAHGGDPALTWMADNVVVRHDPAGNIKPDKEKSVEKIDGIVATIMALDRATRHMQHDSIYKKRGLRVL